MTLDDFLTILGYLPLPSFTRILSIVKLSTNIKNSLWKQMLIKHYSNIVRKFYGVLPDSENYLGIFKICYASYNDKDFSYLIKQNCGVLGSSLNKICKISNLLITNFIPNVGFVGMNKLDTIVMRDFFDDMDLDCPDLTNVTNISIFNISSFPIGITNMINLTSIKINECSSLILPKEFFHLKKVKTLDVSNINSSCYDHIHNMINLEDLTISYCELHDIPVGIFKLHKLKELCLDYNHITTVPNDITKLTNLTHVSLIGNKVRSMPVLNKNVQVNLFH